MYLIWLVLDPAIWIILFGSSFLAIIVSFIIGSVSGPCYPNEIPRVGHEGSGWLSKLRNSLAYFTHHRRWVKEGYYKYGKRNMTFISPSCIALPDDVVLPRSQIAWMMDQPENVLATNECHSKTLNQPYNFLGHDLDHDNFGTRAVYRYLARQLPSLIPNIQDEADAVVVDVFGTDMGVWKKVNLHDILLEIIPRVTNQLLVGKPICQQEPFLKAMSGFGKDVVRNNFLLKFFPHVLHPIVGRLFGISNWLHWREAHKFLLPTIQQRLHDMQQKELGNPEYKDWTPPEDFITWDIRLALAERSSFELDPIVISKRILPIEFAAIAVTVRTAHAWILHLLCTRPEEGVIDKLREELYTRKPATGRWTKASLISLVHVDSSIRESQRLSNFSASLVKRQVVKPEGLYNPAFGWTIPYGAFVTINVEGIHHDEELYLNARDFDPWRASRVREAWEQKSEYEKQQNSHEGIEVKRLGMVTTSDTHFAFGHGRRACPGRIFVAHQLKLVIAAILLNYDLKLIDPRLKSDLFSSDFIPKLDVCIEIRYKNIR
ncbi:cytochrome P450 [Mariannaea sp. PMI_226]|nr:cytochrome P450 [Mariannaea sp. PMI_226]